MSDEKLKGVKADSVEEFLEDASSAIGEGKGVLGNTEFHLDSKLALDDKGLVVKAKLSVETSTIRAHWSGGKADKNNKKAIQEAEDLNAKHEAKHRKLATDIANAAFKDAEKDMLGKSEAEAQAILDKITADIDAAYKDLDAKEGMTFVQEKKDGSFDVTQRPAR